MTDNRVTVVDLRTGESQIFTCSPEEAVVAAYAQSNRDFNTWDYEKRYGNMVLHGTHTVICGDFSAYCCKCHPHYFSADPPIIPPPPSDAERKMLGLAWDK